MLEGVRPIRRLAANGNQIGSNELCEGGLQRIIRFQSGGRQQSIGKFATDCCTDLSYSPGRTELNNPSTQRLEQRRRNRERRRDDRRDVSVTQIIDQFGFQYGLGELLDV